MNDLKNYLQLKNILDIVSDGNRTDGFARDLRSMLDVELLEKMQERIKKIEEEMYKKGVN